jgi:hypothetical protein
MHAAEQSTERAFRPQLDLAVPAVIRLAEMGVQLAVLAWLRPPAGPSLIKLLTKWDAAYYSSIASSWYPAHVHLGISDQTAGSGSVYAFYPLYPAVAGVLRLAGFSTRYALLTTAALAGVAASVLVHLLARHVAGSRRAGYLACAALGALPMAVTLQMGYAESLYIAVVAGALLAALTQRWWLAGLLALCAGLTRPAGLLVPLVLPLAGWTIARTQPIPWRRVASATVLGFAGSPLFWLYLWWRSGRADAWFAAEKRGWNSHLDFGAQTWDFLTATLKHPDGAAMAPITAAIVVAAVVACLLAVLNWRSLPLVLLGVLSVALALGVTNYWHSKPRLLLAAFPLLVLAAGPLAQLRLRTSAVLVVSGVLASAWFGAYALAIWPYAI